MEQTSIEHMFLIASDEDNILIHTSFTKYPIRVHKSKLKYSFFCECLRMNITTGRKRNDRKYMIPLDSIKGITIINEAMRW